MHFCPVHPGSHPRPDGRLSAVQHFQRGALPLDWLVGTGATLLATTCMYLLRRATLWKLPLPALLMPAVWNAVLVGWELTYYIGEIPFWLNAVYVAAGEAAVLLVLGTALYFALGSRRLQERLFPQGV